MTFSVPGQQSELARHIGFQERPPGSNRQPWTEWHFYGRLRNLAYCGSGADYCSVEGGGFHWPSYAQNGYRGSAFVPTIVEVGTRMGIRLPPQAIAPIGSYGIFDWNWDGNEDHVGIKAPRADGTDPDDGDRFFSGEFNTSNGCFYKVRDRKYLVCWIALPLAGQSAPPAPTPQPTEEVMERTVKPAGGDKALNIVSAAKIVWTPTSLSVAATGDCTITPVGFKPDKTQEIVRAIKKPLFGVFDHGNDPKLAYGEFVIAGADKHEFKFTVT